MNRNTNIAVIMVGIAAIVSNLVNISQHSKIDDLQKHPTYHCDGSTTMGYAVPGTPEAAACWIEGGEK